LAEAFKKSDIQILLSTMNRQDLDFLLPMFPFSHFSNYSILIINQTTEDVLLESDYPSVTVINSFERGLSESRNMAIENSVGKLGIITDDDVVFNENFEQHILDSFTNYPDAGLIAFRIEKAPGILYKKYPSETKTQLDTRDRMGIMSIEMVVNLNFIRKEGIRFDRNFGLGAKFCMGEEALFVDVIHRHKKQIVMAPKILAIHNDPSTHQKVTLYQRYFVQGAVCSALFRRNYMLWVLLKLLFDIKQEKVKLTQTHNAIKAAMSGHKEYKRELLQNLNMQAS